MGLGQVPQTGRKIGEYQRREPIGDDELAAMHQALDSYLSSLESLGPDGSAAARGLFWRMLSYMEDARQEIYAEGLEQPAFDQFVAPEEFQDQ